MDKKILLAKEVARILRVDKQRIYELVRTNKIPVIRLGNRQYRFSAEAIEKFCKTGAMGKDAEVKNNE